MGSSLSAWPTTHSLPHSLPLSPPCTDLAVVNAQDGRRRPLGDLDHRTAVDLLLKGYCQGRHERRWQGDQGWQRWCRACCSGRLMSPIGCETGTRQRSILGQGSSSAGTAGCVALVLVQSRKGSLHRDNHLLRYTRQKNRDIVQVQKASKQSSRQAGVTRTTGCPSLSPAQPTEPSSLRLMSAFTSLANSSGSSLNTSLQ